MIPSILSQQLKQGVKDFLKTTFPVPTPFFHGVVDDLLSEDDKVFKGHYLSIQLLFKKGSGRPDVLPGPYVAATRAKKEVIVTSFGVPSEFLSS